MKALLSIQSPPRDFDFGLAASATLRPVDAHATGFVSGVFSESPPDWPGRYMPLP